LANSGVVALVSASEVPLGEYEAPSGEVAKLDRDMLMDGKLTPIDGGDMAAEFGSVMLGLRLSRFLLLSKAGYSGTGRQPLRATGWGCCPYMLVKGMLSFRLSICC
jgi:hypothetical protein